MTETILRDETDQATTAHVSIAEPATVALAGEQGCEVACSSNQQQPPDASEEAIRERAHRKWEAAGRPAGDGLDFWLEAEREIQADRAGASSAQEPGGQTR